MSSKTFTLTLICAAALAAPAQSTGAPQDDELNTSVRGAFFATRPGGDGAADASSGKPSRPGRPSTRNKPGSPRNGKTKPPPRTTPKGDGMNTKPAPAPAPAAGETPSPGALGIGYTLYQRDPQGRLVRARAGQEFVRGDGVRLSIEPNAAGYLYIFNADDSGTLRMLYPHGRLDGGQNKVSAHVTYQVPAAAYNQEFVFDATPGTERLYIVVTREPLKKVETGDALVRLCQAIAADAGCEWEAPPPVLAAVRQGEAERKLSVRDDASAGQPQTADEVASATRGLTLGKAAPAPTVILLNASPAAGIFVTAIDLVHR